MKAGEMKKGFKRIAVSLVSIALCLALLGGVAIPQRALGGPAKEEVTIGALTFFTGALSNTGLGYQGFFDYVKYINDKGGINGVKVNLIWEETGKDPVGRAIIGERKFREAGVVAIISMAALQGEVLLRSLERDEIPMWAGTAFTQQMISKPQWLWTISPSMGDEVVAALEYFLADWTEKHPMRVGVFFYDHVTGWEALRGAEWAQDHLDGIEVVGHEVGVNPILS